MAKRKPPPKFSYQRLIDSLTGRSLWISETVRRDIVERMAADIALAGAADQATVLRVAREYLAMWEPLLAEHLSNAMILTWLGGYIEEAGKLPPLVAQLLRNVNLWAPPAPPELPGIFGRGAKSPKAVRFPKIEKAAESLFRRGLLTRQQFDGLEAAAKQAAFTVAYIDDTKVIGKIRDALAETIDKGATLPRFKELIEKRLGESPIGAWHQETVYRTNLMAAFRDGRESLAQHPIVAEVFPFQAIHATHDGRVRDEHLALETLGIDGTNIYYRADKMWDFFTPPWDYNCRCLTTLMRVADAARYGVREAQEWLRTGRRPDNPTYCLDRIPFRPKSGFGMRHGELLAVM